MSGGRIPHGCRAVYLVAEIENSTIAHTDTWSKNSQIGMEHYKRKHGFYPTQTPQPKDGEMVSNNLRYILENRLL